MQEDFTILHDIRILQYRVLRCACSYSAT